MNNIFRYSFNNPNQYLHFMRGFVNEKFNSNEDINHEKHAIQFKNLLSEKFNNEEFATLLTISGFIPDLYRRDSSEETLFTKMVEVLVAEWAERMDFEAKVIKEKSSKEDIKITINRKVIVSDAKSFRLGRSQGAPNVKDFVKPEDIRKWMRRYDNAIGGLITYPCTHEWKRKSDVYTYCSQKSIPTLMLPYKYLAYILLNKNNYNPNNLLKLWDYNNIFPNRLKRSLKGGNKQYYWNAINNEVIKITNTNNETFNNFMEEADRFILRAVNDILDELKEIKQRIESDVKERINDKNIEEIKNDYINYKVKKETHNINTFIKRIKNKRL